MSSKRYAERPDRPSPFGYPAERKPFADEDSPESTFRTILHVLTTATEPEEVLNQIAIGALRIGKVDGAYIERVVDGNKEVEVVAAHGQLGPRIGMRATYPGSLTEEVIKKGKPEIIGDLTGDPRPMARHITERCGPCSALAAPLLAATDVLGALVLLRCPGVVPFTSEDATRILTLADLGTVTFRRVRMLEETESARQQANVILESVTDAFFALDRDWKFTYVNRQAEALLQKNREELLGRVIWEEFPESVGSRFYHEYHEALSERQPRDFEEYFAPLQVWWEVHAVPVRDGLTVYLRDVTSRKRREETLRVLAEAGAVLNSTLNYRETLAQVARLVIPVLADWSVIDVFENGEVERVEVAARDPSKQEMARKFKQYVPDPGNPRSPVATVLRTGKPILIPKITREFLESAARGPEHVQLALQLGIRSVMIVPLIARKHTVGVLSLIAGESERTYGEEDLALARALADRAALAVDNARLFKLAQDSRAEAELRAAEEEALRRAAAAVSAVFTIKEIVQEIAQNALAATNADSALVERVDWPVHRAEVVAIAGRRALPLGALVPYRGSLAELVLDHKGAEFIQRLSSEAGRISADLVAACPDCAALAVPLEDQDEAIGALILLREQGSFSPDEAERARTFADLAALAFRKVHLLEESERQRQALATVIESRSRLIRGFSHDVKNPIGAADGFLQLLESGVFETLDDAKEVIARARRALRDGLKLIEDLLELAKAEAGQIAVEYDRVDLAEVVNDMAESYRVHAQGKGLALNVEIEPELPFIQSDASRLRQVLGNLLSNAVKYTQEGQISIRASVREDGEAPASGRWIALEVRDTGPGIPEEQQKLLFEEFKRLDPAGAEQGSGIGLAISRRIARILNGEITVKSASGAGCTFTLWLPAALNNDISG